MREKKPTPRQLAERFQELERELAHEKEIELKFKTVFDNSVEGIILTDETGTVTDWNKFIAGRTGITQDYAIGRKLWDLQYSLLSDEWKEMFPVETLEQIWLNLIETLSEDKPKSNEGQYFGKNGQLVLTEDIVCPIILNNKKCLCIIQRDLTERRNAEKALKESEEKLKQLNATKDKFFSIIAHDLKSPFNTINGYSQLLKKSIREADTESSEKYLEAIISSSQNTYILLNNLLTWARNELGMVPYNPVNNSVHKMVDDVNNLLIASARLKEIKITNSIPDYYTVIADENMIKTVVHNLISNAIKYTGRSGEIAIDIIQEETEIKICISDNGVGIRQDDLKNLFNISKIHTTRGTEEEGGTGLGLLICKEFVEKHGGKLGAESEYGKGSTFWFSLPYNANQ
jgi:PAS domain S-box-containing protein